VADPISIDGSSLTLDDVAAVAAGAPVAELQVNLVRSHAAGVGPLLPVREVRALMLLRANVIAKGYSGARPDLAALLVGMLNAGLQPRIPEQGSVGASGDLAPLAHLALSLIGESCSPPTDAAGQRPTCCGRRAWSRSRSGPRKG
jgi:histidine ammonia-lyase